MKISYGPIHTFYRHVPFCGTSGKQRMSTHRKRKKNTTNRRRNVSTLQTLQNWCILGNQTINVKTNQHGYALDLISSLFSDLYTPMSFSMVITTGISKSNCIAMNSSPIPDKYRFLTISFFSSGINFGWDSYAL